MDWLTRIRPPVGTLALLALAMSPPCARAAQPPLVSEQAIHAAFTLNLTRFVTWPKSAFATPEAPLVIGTFPRDPINAELDRAVSGEKVEGRPVTTIRIQAFADLAKCHVVFLSESTRPPATVLQQVAGKPVLTISNHERFLELGGHVRFVSQPPRTALRISVANLKTSGLECRSQLLRLAAAP